MAKATLGDLLKKKLIEARSAEIQHEEHEALEMSLSDNLVRGTDKPTAIDTGGWLKLLKNVNSNVKGQGHYELTFTSAFWRSVEELGLCRSEILAQSLRLIDNPFLGRKIGEQESSIRAWDIEVTGKGKFSWYYIVDEELYMTLNVFVSSKPTRNHGEDAILLAKLFGITMGKAKA